MAKLLFATAVFGVAALLAPPAGEAHSVLAAASATSGLEPAATLLALLGAGCFWLALAIRREARPAILSARRR